MPIPADLQHFAAREFRNPTLLNESAAYVLDSVRTRYGKPLIITSDARTPKQNIAAGGSPTSLHLVGRAFDLRWIPDAQDLWDFVGAVYATNRVLGAAFELELVNSIRDQHIHFGVYPNQRRSRLIVAAD